MFFQESLYQAMYKCEDKIYLIPCWAREIAVYDTSCDKFTKIRLNKIEDYNDRLLFCKCFGINQELYCIPYSYKAIVRIDLQTQEISYDDLNYLAGDSKSIYLGDAALMDRKIVCTWNRSNHLLVIDLSDGQMTLRTVGEKGCQFTKISGLDNQLVLYDSFLKNIVIKSLNDGRSRIVANISSDSAFKISAINDDIIMVDMADSDEVICIDQGGRICFEKREKKGKKGTLAYSYYSGIIAKTSDITMYFDTTNRRLYEFNIAGEIRKSYNIGDCESALIEPLLLFSLQTEQQENDLMLLEKWLHSIDDGKNEVGKRHDCGVIIKDFVKSFI